MSCQHKSSQIQNKKHWGVTGNTVLYLLKEFSASTAAQGGTTEGIAYQSSTGPSPLLSYRQLCPAGIFSEDQSMGLEPGSFKEFVFPSVAQPTRKVPNPQLNTHLIGKPQAEKAETCRACSRRQPCPPLPHHHRCDFWQPSLGGMKRQC